MNNKRHLDYDDLLKLYLYISKEFNQSTISSLLNCDRSTVYRIIMNHRKYVPGRTIYKSKYLRDCAHLKECSRKGICRCPSNCINFKEYVCEDLKSFPFICDFCLKKSICTKNKYYFNPETAYRNRTVTLRESRSMPNFKKSYLDKFGNFLKEYVDKGLSIEVIESKYKDIFPVSARQVRNWIDKRYIIVKRCDLINAQKRDYKGEYHYKRASNNPLIKANRTYTCYQEYIKETLNKDRFEFDTVHGKKEDLKCILTIHYPKYEFQFGRLVNKYCEDDVIKRMVELRETLGKDDYYKLFKVILADNGIEFDKLPLLETDPIDGEKITRVFYTRPYNSGDKGSCEKNHEIFRYIKAKGKTLDDLTQEDIDNMFSNINSYPRKSLGYKTPYELMAKEFGKNIIKKLGIIEIPFDNLTFK